MSLAAFPVMSRDMETSVDKVQFAFSVFFFGLAFS
jgi:hypothetical protein